LVDSDVRRCHADATGWPFVTRGPPDFRLVTNS
jgi:hypothetical protein